MSDQVNPPQTDQKPMADPQQIVQILTTEHFTLQTARSATISDANGRSNLFLGAVSSAIVALAFIGQASNMGDSFSVFALVIFPCLFFLGLTTFSRVLETAIEDAIYAQEINRIRHYYIEIAPSISRYFIQSTHDDMRGMSDSMGLMNSRFQILLTTAGMVSWVNSTLAGVFIGVVIGLLLKSQLLVTVIIGVIAFGISLALHTAYQTVQWTRTMQKIKTLFPTPADDVPAK